MTTTEDLHGEPCPPHIEQACVLLSAVLAVLDMDLTEAALEADLLLRDENPRWIVTATAPDAYQPPPGGWLDPPVAEAALRDAVEHLDTHASTAVAPAERLVGTAAAARLMRTLRQRPDSAAWVADRDARIVADVS